MKGVYRYPDGSEYTGDWQEGQRHGYGVMNFPDGSKYFGIFDNGLCQGNGIMVFNDNSRYTWSTTYKLYNQLYTKDT